MFISKTLNFYKRQDVQDAILNICEGKEVSVIFGDRGFGKRPDTLQHRQDILEFAKKGATSFHASEETWYNPLQIETGISKKELSELRKGWDFVLDIDCPIWEFSKLTAHLVVKALKKHNIRAVSVKFSGNKGFHVAVPFESFPQIVGKEETKNLFPEAARKMALYIIYYISSNYISVDKEVVSFDGYKVKLTDLKKQFPEKNQNLTNTICTKCNIIIKNDVATKINFVCSNCNTSINTAEDLDHHICPKCKSLMERFVNKKGVGCKCQTTANHITQFNPLSIIEVDTVLISSRHLFRMIYSFHETSELVSVPVDTDNIMNFEKDQAKPGKAIISNDFLDRSKAISGEAAFFLTQALDFEVEQKFDDKPKKEFDYEDLDEAIPEEFFPPCIKFLLKGLEDGKKRALFALTNFLSSAGWDYEMMEKRLREWNKLNPESLRETYFLGQLRYAKTRKERVLPPNCSNDGYYGLLRSECKIDPLCQRVKNPLQFAKIKSGIRSKKKSKK